MSLPPFSLPLFLLTFFPFFFSFQCKCGALPSACWTLSNSKKLPPGVYQCDAATTSNTTITAVEDGHAYKVEDLVSGNFSIVTVSMSPVDSGSDWEENDVAQLTILGTTSKKILAGTFKYQIFETEVKSFIASGDSPYFQCDHKGCDPTKGIALNFKTGTDGAFDLSMTVSLPQAQR